MHLASRGRFDQVNISRGRLDQGVISKGGGGGDLTKIFSLGADLAKGQIVYDSHGGSPYSL